ncbi:MAG: hypothetical protein VX738_14895 [Planctomycetota bacterium]|nr:hypothetical protein [Planctomycetota bacterium]
MAEVTTEVTMAGDGITILHASDFQLDVPLGGVRWIPEAIKQELLDAPRSAAQRVFDSAVTRQVDALVLTGNLVAPERATAASLDFIQSELLRMEQNGIAVIWATGTMDSITQWPRCMRWPESLIRFDAGTAQRRMLTLGGREIEVLGTGCDQSGIVQPEWFAGLSRGDPALVVCGGALANHPQDPSVPLWLLGSCRHASAEAVGDSMLVHSGTPQGRDLHESGLHGAQLITMNDRIECSMIQCADVIYERIHLNAGPIEDLDDLEMQLLHQCESRGWDASQRRLVQWHVDGCEDSPLVRDTDPAFIDWQTNLGNDSTLTQAGVFSLGVAVSCRDATVNAEQGADLLGDYLFTLEALRENGWEGIELGSVGCNDGVPPDWARIEEDLAGLRTLQCAARLGELLLGSETTAGDSHQEEAA